MAVDQWHDVHEFGCHLGNVRLTYAHISQMHFRTKSTSSDLRHCEVVPHCWTALAAQLRCIPVYFSYDGRDILFEFDGVNTLLARFTYGAGIDQPLVMERDLDASGTFDASERFFYHNDGLGSVTDLTDSAGAVIRAYVYDAYGGIAQETGTLANPFTYTGREFDVENGLYFYRARYYDAMSGRFLSTDPLGFSAGDSNLYRYVFNNPINLTDPLGLQVGCFNLNPSE